MRYDQVNHALTFLTKPGDMITLQVPYHEDVDLVVRPYTRPCIWATSVKRSDAMENGTWHPIEVPPELPSEPPME